MKKILLLSAFACFTIMPASFGQDASTVSSDTVKASKIAQKAQKLYASGKEKKIAKAIELYKQAGSMGLPSACRFLSDYYMTTTPPDTTESIRWTEILGDMGDEASMLKLVDIYSGRMAASGYPSTSNIPKLLEWSKSLANRGNMVGMENSGACYLLQGDTTQALGWLEKAAEKGSLPSQVALAHIYSQPGSNNVPELAFKYADKASEQGDMECTYMLGNMYMSGYGCPQDYSKAYSCFEKCVGQPIDALDFNMAYCKVEMNGGKMDESAFNLLQSAADKGNPMAQRVVGDCYANGDVVNADLNKALEWYEKAAAQNDPYAQYSASVLLLTGNAPIVQDQAKGLELLEKAASNGLTAAQNDLGMFYLSGRYVEKDTAKGISLLEQASEGGNVYAQSTLASLYFQGNMVGKDETKALRLMQAAAAQGFPEAQFNTGYFYMNKIGTSGLTADERLVTDELVQQSKASNGVITEDQLAIYWIRKASDSGHPMAQANLAMMILSGNAAGTESEAVALLQKSSDQGLADAQYSLGSLYYSGKAGLTKDVQKGLGLIKKAADQGLVQAQYELGMLYLNGDAGVSQNKKTGFNYMKKAADQGVPAAMYYVALCYYQGIGVTANLAETKKWLKKASSQNDDPQVKATAAEALKNIM